MKYEIRFTFNTQCPSLLNALLEAYCTYQNGDTALTLAAIEGHDEIFPMLLKAGAKVNQINNVNAYLLYILIQFFFLVLLLVDRIRGTLLGCFEWQYEHGRNVDQSRS